MPRFLKRGMDASAIKAADAKVRETVEGILAQVEEKKDLAIRELSKQFDHWAPKDFRSPCTSIAGVAMSFSFLRMTQTVYVAHCFV